jgi:3-hydroxyisobutyrate dehydrogenase-like beta-hydroxyacid dehydrogenase
MSLRIGFVGIGTMGAEMAWSGARAKLPLTVFDVSSEAMQRLAEVGATRAGSPAEVAAESDMVSIVVMDDAQVLDVVCGAEGVLEGARSDTIIAIHSTVHLDTVREVARQASLRGIEVLDACVSGGPHSAHDGSLAVMVGGSKQAFEICLPAFNSYGGLVLHMGPVGSGTITKLARNLVGFAWCASAYEGMRVIEESGLDLEAFRQLYTYSEEHAGLVSRYLARPTTTPADVETRPDWIRLADYRLPKADKDLDAVIEYARQLGFELPVTEASRAEMPAVWGKP